MRRIVQRLVIAAIWLGSAGFLFAWSGIYNVAASGGHWAIVDTFLRFGMRHSVSLRAGGVHEPDLSSRDLISLGAGHFERGCAFCHGSPDAPKPPIASAMLPAPPSLATPLFPWSNQELFWIIRHGIKYTGMPAWPAIERTDEIWALVAFIRQLADMDAETYRALALPKSAPLEMPDRTADAKLADAVRQCAICHGDRDSQPDSALVPRLHGQRQAFLKNALHQYASGTRPSGVMQLPAADLDAHTIDRLAQYYAGLPPVPAASPMADDAQVEHGRKLAMEGDPVRRIPACLSCHGPQAHETFPTLDGQSAAYLSRQLRLWKAGHNTATDGAAIMAPIGLRLRDEDIDALSRYFAGNTPQQAADTR
jgi:cytochrome c553